MNVISVNHLLEIRDCEKKRMFSEFTNPDEKMIFLFNCINIIKKGWVDGTKLQEMKTDVEVLFSAFKEEWFAFPAEFKQAKEKYLGMMMRLMQYLYEKNVEIIKVDKAYVISMEKKYKNSIIDGISGFSDLIIKT